MSITGDRTQLPLLLLLVVSGGCETVCVTSRRRCEFVLHAV